MKIKPVSLRKAGITISSTCRNMVINGCTNEEIWDVLRRLFNAGENQRHYPAWYRAEVNRKGLAAN